MANLDSKELLQETAELLKTEVLAKLPKALDTDVTTVVTFVTEGLLRNILPLTEHRYFILRPVPHKKVRLLFSHNCEKRSLAIAFGGLGFPAKNLN